MRVRAILPILTLAAAALTGGDASAQVDRSPAFVARGEAIIYRDAGYRGPAVNVSRSQANMRLNWPVGSIRVRSGTWELCQQPDFRGRCTVYAQDTSAIPPMLRTVQSLRPVGGGGPPPRPTPGDPGPSLRGMAAEFFTRPAEGGQRVIACARGPANAGCGQRTAEQFCRERGYSGAGHSALETSGRQVYLADVLCTRSGR